MTIVDNVIFVDGLTEACKPGVLMTLCGRAQQKNNGLSVIFVNSLIL